MDQNFVYILAFAAAAGLSALITPFVRRYALKHQIMALPDARKIHLKPIPYLGGLAIFCGFVIPAMIFLPLDRRFVALLSGIAILVAVGVIDDIKNLHPLHKLAWQLIAAMVVLAGGIGIASINNPFGGVINLSAWRFPVELFGWHFHIAPIANTLSILWMIGLVNAINFLDGLDGLACGVSAIAGLIMFMLSIGPKVNQPEVALLAIIMTGAAVGFLPYNFFPAKIFMGDGGAYFLGLTLALLAIYSGGKLATASLVLGFTIFDSVWAVARRLYNRTSPFKPDKGHLHHLLLEAGFSQRRAVLMLYALSLLFGTVAVFSGSFAKLVSLLTLFIVLTVATAYLTALSWRKSKGIER
jgi:UDP-GlcNAc:undecaprenyl-phosphate/decaprenyl-phosphate GlcNAc-1-phosphate transferase